MSFNGIQNQPKALSGISGNNTTQTENTTNSIGSSGTLKKTATTKKSAKTNVEQKPKDDNFTKITSSQQQIANTGELLIDNQVKSEKAPRKTSPSVGTLSSKEGKTGTDSVTLGGNLESKPLHETFQKLEKDLPKSMSVQQENAQKQLPLIENRDIRGQRVEVHKKMWQLESSQGAQKSLQKMQQGETVSSKFGDLVEKRMDTTQYLNEGQRQKLEITPERTLGTVKQKIQGETTSVSQHNAKLIQKDGKPLNTTGMQEKRAIFVMDDKGKVYGANEHQQRIGKQQNNASDFHHSSFLGGGAVTGAGELTTNKEGYLTKMTDRSGHYRPGATQTLQTIDQLQKKGVNMDNVQFEIHRGSHQKPEVTKGMVGEYVQGGGSESLFKARHDVMDEIRKTVPETQPLPPLKK